MGKVTSKIFNLKGEAIGKVHLPLIFRTTSRPDIIKRAVISIQSHSFQHQGRNKLAGKRTTAESRGVGLGASRIPRIKGGSQKGAFAPGTVGGRQAHPPVKEKKIVKRIPKKEMLLALRSAIAATSREVIVTSRGHITDDVPDFPLVVADEIQNLKKTKEVKDAFIQLGVWPDIFRVKQSRKVRAGKGKMRGRKMKQATGPLLVVAKDGGISRAARNIAGLNVALVENLDVECLAPGANPGRLTLWTDSAIKKLEESVG